MTEEYKKDEMRKTPWFTFIGLIGWLLINDLPPLQSAEYFLYSLVAMRHLFLFLMTGDRSQSREGRQSSINIGGRAEWKNWGAGISLCELVHCRLPNPLDGELLDPIDWYGIWWVGVGQISKKFKIIARSQHEMYHFSRNWHSVKEVHSDGSQKRVSRHLLFLFTCGTCVLIQIHSSSSIHRCWMLIEGEMIGDRCWSEPFNWHQALVFCRPPLWWCCRFWGWEVTTDK